MDNSSKRQRRIKRSKKLRARCREANVRRLVVHRTSRHLYAQLVEPNPQGDKVLVSFSSLDLRKQNSQPVSNVTKEIAKTIGATLAKKALDFGVNTVSFDRSGFKYHGQVEALAAAARAEGLKF